MNSFLKKFDKTLPLGFIGILATLILGIPALYVTSRERIPQVKFEVNSIVDVIDVRRPLDELSVLFEGNDIQNQKKNLQILNVSLVNRGGKDVIQVDYDQSQPFGLRVEGATIVGKPRVVFSNSHYLINNLNPIEVNADSIELNKLILEREKFASLEILILHDLDKQPSLISFGKIAGQDEIKVIDAREHEYPGFWTKVIQGGFIINSIRFIVSCTVFFLLLFAISGIVDYFTSKMQDIKLKRAKSFLNPFTEKHEPSVVAAILEIWHASGGTYESLSKTCQLIENNNLLSEIHDAYEELLGERKDRLVSPRDPSDENYMKLRLSSCGDQFFNSSDDGLVVNEEVLSALKSLSDYIQKNPPPQGVDFKDYRLYEEFRDISFMSKNSKRHP